MIRNPDACALLQPASSWERGWSLTPFFVHSQLLTCNVDTLNEHFANTATRTTGVETSDIREDFIDLIDTLLGVESLTANATFTLEPITFREVLRQLNLV